MGSVIAAVHERITTTGAGNATAVGAASSAPRMGVANASGASSASVALAGPPSKRVTRSSRTIAELIGLREEVKAEMSRRGAVVDEVEKLAPAVAEEREAREEANAEARSRIARLADDEMVELSSDVRDVKMRRKNAPFLAPRYDLLPKRNEARKELSKLPSRELKMLYSIIHESMNERKKTAIDGAKKDTTT
ncbi:hypothetical protein HK101_003726 [Irineochytrium annulatum]|nr:hypothetical protein HK101_003726 [Irineochytrium annulatum]